MREMTSMYADVILLYPLARAYSQTAEGLEVRKEGTSRIHYVIG